MAEPAISNADTDTKTIPDMRMDLSPCCWRTRIGLSVPKALRSDAIAPLETEARSSANVIFDRAGRKVTELDGFGKWYSWVGLNHRPPDPQNCARIVCL